MSASSQIVTFRLGEDFFAADIFSVERVLRYEAPTPVPNLPAWIEGVIDYQGRVVPLLDLRSRFELEQRPIAPQTRILIFTAGGDWVGAVVDAVVEVAILGEEQLAPPPPLFRGLAGEYLRGIARRNGRLVVYLDVDRLLATTERLKLDPPNAVAVHG
jgi:purine-binding chemotaxis protein CheW